MNLPIFQYGLFAGILFLHGASGSPAMAGEIAVLDFDGYGVSHDDAILVSQGFRDALLESGVFFPIESYDITERYMVGYEEDISRARELVGVGRKYLDSGNLAGALKQFDAARELHQRAGSPLARRPEAADVEYFIGLTYLRQGRTTQAQSAIETTLRLYPGYDTYRAGQKSSQVDSAFERARANIMSGKKVLLEPDEASQIANRLGVSAVLSGYIDVEGVIYARLIEGSRVLNELTWTVEEIPPFPGDPLYGRFVADITAGALDSTSSANFTTQRGFPEAGSDAEFDELPEFEAQDQPAQQNSRRPAPTNVAQDPSFRQKVEGFFRSRDTSSGETTAQIRQEGGRLRYNDVPITQRWWFWTATGAVTVGGVAAAVVVAKGRGDSDSTETPGVYTVTVGKTSN